MDLEELQKLTDDCISQLMMSVGPSDEDFIKAQEFGRILSSKGDILLYGGKTKKMKDEQSQLLKDLCFSIAVLSFLPGGITLFGHHWESKK